MQLLTLSFSLTTGWSRPLPTELDGPRTLVLAFGAPLYGQDEAALQALRDALPQAVQVGCSTAGEIFEGEVRDNTLSVAVIRFESTELVRAVTPVADREDSAAAGQRLAAQLQHPGLQAVLLFSEGVQVNGTALVDALSRHLPPGVALSGGLAGDAYRFERTVCQDVINHAIDLMRDVQHTDRSLDELLQRELRDEAEAWRRQTMPTMMGRI